jgi:starch phosphorylase
MQTQENPQVEIQVEDDRTGLSVETLRRAFADNLFYIVGRYPTAASPNDFYMALAYTVRDRILQRWLSTIQLYRQQEVKVVCYLSAEFLIGPQLANNLINLNIYDQVREAIAASGLNLNDLIEQEEEPGLGNGGLGRLAACYLDSLATLEIPAIGYGIRYEFGIFNQEIENGWQQEITDRWLRNGFPWEIARLDRAVTIQFGGYTKAYTNQQGQYQVRWMSGYTVQGVPYDTPILGFKKNTANTLRLWKAEAGESFDFQKFNEGDYYGAVEEKTVSENITKVLYPNDEPLQGKLLRLQQQYFFVSCSLQDMIRTHLFEGDSLDNFHEKFAVQLNDTHPTIAIAELMHLLLDEHGYDWDQAWNITQNTFAYTNHTLLPEALERWPVSLFGSLLPRHLEIIYEINHRFLQQVRDRFPGDDERVRRMSLIEEGQEQYVRMAYLACVGSHAINGVAELHSQLLKDMTLRDFNEMFPEKFFNITNGVTPRRWMVQSNPRLSFLIADQIGDRWITHLDELRNLEPFAEDHEFRKLWRQTQEGIKADLASYIKDRLDIEVNPQSLFDVQVKRIHEYKRQHLNVLHIITLYNRIKQNPDIEITPRTFIFGGKSAPGYKMAKLIIKLINSVGDVVNNDPDVRGRLTVVFLPDYSVKLGQRIYPAADLSEQISTAGKEASGTGNMKFAMNGALTIGTLDGANIEIRKEVGEENFFLFGLTAPEVADLKAKGYNPRDYYDRDPNLKAVIDAIANGTFSPDDPKLFKPLIDSLLTRDEYLLLADYPAYIECQDRVSEAYRDLDRWSHMSILNTARIGKFSSDRSIREYCQEIWKADPISVRLCRYDGSQEGIGVRCDL